MSDRAVPLRELILGCTILLCAAALYAGVRLIEPVYTVLYAVLTAVGVFIDRTGRRHPPRLLLNIVSICVLAASVMRMRPSTFIAVFTEAILLMTAVKMLEEKSSRDYFQITALSVFAVIIASVDASDVSFLYCCAVISVLACYELILAAWLARSPDSSLSIKELLQVFGRSLVIWAMMLPLCFLLFFSAPRARLTLGRLQMARGQDNRVGFSDHIRLGSVRAIKEDNSLAFRAIMPPVAPKYLYWRGIVLDYFDGETWSARRMRENSAVQAPPGNETVRQDIFMENIGYMRAIFALDVPVSTNTPGVMPAGDGVFVNVNFRERVKSYSVVSSLSDRVIPSSGNIQMNRYTNLPPDFSPAIEDLARSIVFGLSDEEKPEAVMGRLLSPEYSYTISDLPVSSRPLDDFIFTWKKGNCEYFACAMAVMLRMTGVPARLVAGYRGGVYNDSGGYYMVSQSSAHVWVEAWSGKEGAWIRYNPTPASAEGEGGADDSAGYGLLSMYIDYINYQLSRAFLEYGSDTQQHIIEAVREIFSSPGYALASAFEALPDAGSAYGAAAAAVSASLLVVFVKYRGCFRARGKFSREEALREKFLAAMRRCGFEKKVSEGLEEFVGSVRESDRSGEIYQAASEFVSCFEKIYYRDLNMTGEENRRLRDILARIAGKSRR
ncbi:MAG: DUF3488 and transglutaminase-like domain-containing protein [Synergistaceae bacterium]|jgi:transglutaminase-like putative cysteine protease|nr:DUF3488 and transglutaminase-like domain-containing protein [Synergistaceae bacterium]